MAGVKTLEPGEGLGGLRVDPANHNRCDVIFWPPQSQLPQLVTVPQTKPIAVVLTNPNPLGNLAEVTLNFSDAEGNASTPYLQYQLASSTTWQDATLVMLDGAPYSTNNRVAAPPPSERITSSSGTRSPI